MKKFLLFALLFISSAAPSFASGELYVFAASSMTESMNRLAQEYSKIAPQVKLVFNFDSSGTLKTQIEQGAECDIFISAGQKQMNAIGKRFVKDGTRFNIVANQVVMIVPKGVSSGIRDFRDAAADKVRLIVIGNSDVPVGQYSEEIYRNLRLWDKLNAEKKISFAGSAKEVLAQVAEASATCGIVYSTDAAANDRVEIAAKAPKGSHKPILYPCAIMKASKNTAAADFIKFIRSDRGAKILKSFGFSIPEK